MCVYACVRVMGSKTDLRVSGRQAALGKRPLDFYQANVAMGILGSYDWFDDTSRIDL